ncbi:MAG: 8-amino-7-oxononanoate synthase [Oligoflexales bacterium]
MSTKGNLSWQILEQRSKDLLCTLDSSQSLRSPVMKPQYGLDFCSNDYLGSRTDDDLQGDIRERVLHIPFASGGSRLLGADHRDYQNLELQFALWKKAPASLFFSSGYAANLAVGGVLRSLGACVFSDRLNHASMIDGQRTAKNGNCVVFQHNDLEDLEDKIRTNDSDLKVICTESLFSMGGDRAPLQELNRLAKRQHCILVLDEAHSVGCEGEDGAGSLSRAEIDHDHIITINPCGKALGAQGAFVAGPRWFLDCLVNKGRSFIYSTAPSPWVVQALHAVLERMRSWEKKRVQLHSNMEWIRSLFLEHDIVAPTQSWIVPIVVGEDENAVRFSNALRAQGVHLAAIRPPTVPVGSAGLRLSLRSDMTAEEISCCVRALKETMFC